MSPKHFGQTTTTTITTTTATTTSNITNTLPTIITNARQYWAAEVRRGELLTHYNNFITGVNMRRARHPPPTTPPASTAQEVVVEVEEGEGEHHHRISNMMVRNPIFDRVPDSIDEHSIFF